MNLDLRIKKLVGQSENLLTFYLNIVRKYAILDPMLFSNDVCENFGTGKAANGYHILKTTLYYNTVQDIANLFYDRGNNNPIILNIFDMLDNEQVIDKLRKSYSFDGYGDGSLEDLHIQSVDQRTSEFNLHQTKLFHNITIAKTNPDLKNMKKVRDQFTAHLDLQLTEDDEYQYPDVSKYGLAWGTPKKIISELRPIIEQIGFIIRDSGFSWDAFERQNKTLSDGLWNK
jgi:hypothetical protein